LFEVYKITCNVNNKIYIGITSKGINERWKTHVQTAYSLKNKDSNAIFKKAIRKYKPENFTIEIIDTANSEEEAEEKEIYYIKKYNSFAFDENSNGYNSTRGGDGAKGYGHVPIVEIDIKTASVINEYASFADAEKAYGRRLNHVYDLDTEISTNLNTIFVHKKAIETLSPNELKELVYNCCNPIVQLSETGEFIDIWATVKQVVSTLHIAQGNLSSAISGKRRLANNCMWLRYKTYMKDKDSIKLRNKLTTGVKIVQYTLDGDLVKSFDSVTQASNETGIHHSFIINACKNRIESAGGFLWKYNGANIRDYSAEKIKESRKNRALYRDELKEKQKDKPYTIIDIFTGEKFHSIKEIEDVNAISGKTIRKVLNGEREEYKGHKWQYIK
jgi:group I intron endonuclease